MRDDKDTEAKFKGELVKLIRIELPTFVVIRHEDHFTHGIPDISVTGNKKTLWIEIKFANPNFKSKGIQEVTMLRLSARGHAFYVIYRQTKEKEEYTYVVDPKEIGSDINSWINYVPNFDHAWVIENIKFVLR